MNLWTMTYAWSREWESSETVTSAQITKEKVPFQVQGHPNKSSFGDGGAEGIACSTSFHCLIILRPLSFCSTNCVVNEHGHIHKPTTLAFVAETFIFLRRGGQSVLFFFFRPGCRRQLRASTKTKTSINSIFIGKIFINLHRTKCFDLIND